MQQLIVELNYFHQQSYNRNQKLRHFVRCFSGENHIFRLTSVACIAVPLQNCIFAMIAKAVKHNRRKILHWSNCQPFVYFFKCMVFLIRNSFKKNTITSQKIKLILKQPYIYHKFNLVLFNPKK